MILFKKQLFDLEVKGQGPTKVIMVRDTLPYGHARLKIRIKIAMVDSTTDHNNKNYSFVKHYK
jgi:hypothetical protein